MAPEPRLRRVPTERDDASTGHSFMTRSDAFSLHKAGSLTRTAEQRKSQLEKDYIRTLMYACSAHTQTSFPVGGAVAVVHGSVSPSHAMARIGGGAYSYAYCWRREPLHGRDEYTTSRANANAHTTHSTINSQKNSIMVPRLGNIHYYSQ